MSRLYRLGLVALSLAVVGIPAPTEAGVIPWMYDSLFGPVGSMQASAGYTPYTAGYTPYSAGYSSYYTPYSVGYAPSGCNSCQSYSYAPCGCTPCATGCGTGCTSGNCATGNCSTGAGSTTANSAPSGTLNPVPDPANSARSIENRLQVIEKSLNIAPPNKPRTYDDSFNSVPGRGGNESTVPVRPRGNSTGETFELPPNRGAGGTDDGEMFRENPSGRGGAGSTESLRIPLPGDDVKAETAIPAKAPAPALPIDDKGTSTDGKGTTPKEAPKPQSLRLENRITSRAVSPRERQTISMGFAKPATVATKKPASKLQMDAPPHTVNVAQH